ncbi:MAG: PhzF family phenazine biosynthesis isomerase [Myxococcales bacterium]
MRIPIWQIDAFAERAFAGNPAAVCRLERWLPDATLQAIAAENALSETAFFIGPDDGWRLRWFTPANEVDLCGHATLATAYVVLHRLFAGMESVTFQSQSGPLKVVRRGETLELDFPAWTAKPFEPAPPGDRRRARREAPRDAAHARLAVRAGRRGGRARGGAGHGEGRGAAGEALGHGDGPGRPWPRRRLRLALLRSRRGHP